MKAYLTVTALLISLGCAASAYADASAAPAKPWAADLTGYLNEHPGHWIVGHSTEPALSVDEAESSAHRDAANSLVNETLAPRLSRSADRQGLVDRISVAMQRDGWIADRQIESKARPYGTIWSAAVLVDASPAKVDALVRQIEHTEHVRRERTVAGAIGGSILCGVVGIGYLLTNSLTRGYFRGRLAVASLLIVSTAIFAVVHLI